MKDRLVRFGVAMENELLTTLDHLVELRQSTRSKIISDLARAELARVRLGPGAPACAILSLVYDHHVRDLTERLTEVQHQLGERIRSSLHVHLGRDDCLEVVIMHGHSDELQNIAHRLIGLRGVKHGEIVMFPEPAPGSAMKEHKHSHHHEGDHDHDGPREPDLRHPHPSERKPSRKRPR
jgi:CopG family nickel-responsive transcriptional regulator